MAERPIFISKYETYPGVEEKAVEFRWFPGMSVKQKQRSIQSLHCEGNKMGISPILEISSKSEEKIGIELSAFNLFFITRKNKWKISVESAFQSSKVFESGGPYIDLLEADSRKAKKDERLKGSGRLQGFRFFGRTFPLRPKTFFYDWVYINALSQNTDLSETISAYSAFTDIEFNPARSINCQAYSAALFCSLQKRSMLELALDSPESFLRVLQIEYNNRDKRIGSQENLI